MRFSPAQYRLSLATFQPNLCQKRPQHLLSLPTGACSRHLEHPAQFEGEIARHGYPQQGLTDQVAAQHVAGPVFPQVDAGGTDQHDHRC